MKTTMTPPRTVVRTIRFVAAFYLFSSCLTNINQAFLLSVSSDDVLVWTSASTTKMDHAQLHVTEMKERRRLSFSQHYSNRSNFDISVFYQNHNRSGVPLSNLTVTIATQIHISRTNMQRLLDVLTRWGGPVSVVAYVKKNDYPLKTAELMVFIKKHEGIFREKNIVIQTVTEKRSAAEIAAHPINVLRNIAIERVETNYLFLLDIDLIPSSSSFEKIQAHLKNSPNQDEDKRAWILPAFERKLGIEEDATKINASHLPPTKHDFLTEVVRLPKKYAPFWITKYPPGHGPTNFKKWMGTPVPYLVAYKDGFEPYFVVHNNARLPPLWEHFVGFGRNKVSWVEELASCGYEFHVAHDAFLIHVQHSIRKEGRRKEYKNSDKEYTHFFKPYLKNRYGSAIKNDLSF